MATSDSEAPPRRRRSLPLKRGAGAIKRLVRERRDRMRRGRVKRLAATLLSLALIAYAISPIDLLYDGTALIGRLDDLLLLLAGFWFVLSLLRRAERERRAYRLARDGTALPESPAERRDSSTRTAALTVAATALTLALAYVAQQLWWA